MIIMSKRLPFAEHLTDQEYNLLLETYADHNSSIELNERKNYTLSHIFKVERNIDENCLNVYYENGDLWHYTPDRKWY